MKNTLLFCALLFTGLGFSQTYSKVKIFTDATGLQQLAELGLPVDHGETKTGVFFISDFSESDIAIMQANGFSYEIVVPDVKAYYAEQSGMAAKNVGCTSASEGPLPETPEHFYQNSSYAGFYKYQDMLDALDSMAAAYPNLITVKTPISTFQTHQNRPIYFVKISDSPSTDDLAEPNVLYSAIHHAREPLSMSQVIFYMWHILENYDTDPEIKFMVDNTELFFIPCLNPDGYLRNEANDPSGFGMHRKNMAPVGTTNPGVDLNRNYSYGWNTTGVSPNVNNDTYPGTSAFSEPETQAMKWMVETYGFKTALNAHTYGNQLLFPVGTTVSEFADHHQYFWDLSHHMVTYNHFEAIKSSGLYPASGDSDDYMYKVDIGVGLKDTIFVMTPEIGTDFWPASSEVVPTCAGMVFTNMVMAHITHKYLATTDGDGAFLTTNSGYLHHDVQRLGFEAGPVSVWIDPISNLQTVGSPVVHDLAWSEVDNDSISYTVTPGLPFGSVVKYAIVTDYADWQFRDTVTKIYDQWSVFAIDNATSTTDWTGNWSLTSDAAYSAPTSFTESDGSDYGNDDDKSYEYSPTIDLTLADNAMITFYAKWDIEADYDYCQFQVSTDGGNSWQGQCGLYTVEGSSTVWNGSVQPNGEPVWEGNSDWVQEQISLSDYVGNSVQVRFRFESDGAFALDGFYFDDFKVLIDYTLGMEEQTLQAMLAPNPSNDECILSTLETVSEGSIVVYDQAGKRVLTEEIQTAGKQFKFSTRNLPAGAYLVSIENAGMLMKPMKLMVAH